MSTATTQTADDDVFSKLEDLDHRTHGAWVQCKCTAAEETSLFGEDAIRYEFTPFSDRIDTAEKQFLLPTNPEGSNIEVFLEGLGYSLSTAQLLEGDDFWIHVEDETIRREVPDDDDGDDLLLSEDEINALELWDRAVETMAVANFVVGVAVLGPISAPFTIGYLIRRWRETDNHIHIYTYTFMILLYCIGWGLIVSSYF